MYDVHLPLLNNTYFYNEPITSNRRETTLDILIFINKIRALYDSTQTKIEELYLMLDSLTEKAYQETRKYLLSTRYIGEDSFKEFSDLLTKNLLTIKNSDLSEDNKITKEEKKRLKELTKGIKPILFPEEILKDVTIETGENNTIYSYFNGHLNQYFEFHFKIKNRIYSYFIPNPNLSKEAFNIFENYKYKIKVLDDPNYKEGTEIVSGNSPYELYEEIKKVCWRN